MVSIVSEIVEKCRSKGFVHKPQVVGVVLKSILMDKSIATNLDNHQDKIIELAVDRLCVKNNPQLETLKMQVAMLTVKEDVKKLAFNSQQIHALKSEQLISEILRKKIETEVYGDIILYVLHETKLLDYSNQLIEKETMTALESVIPRNFIHSFITQPPKEKQIQLLDLWKIVWGIRLFNKFIGRESTGIDSFNSNVLNAVNALTKEVDTELVELAKRIEEYQLYVKYTASETGEKYSRIRAEHVNKMQYYAYLEAIRKYMGELETKCKDLNQFYVQQLNEIKKMVDSSSSIAKSTIYPMFIILAENWKQFDELSQSFKEHKHIYQLLKSFKLTYDDTLKEIDIKFVKNEMRSLRSSEVMEEKSPRNTVPVPQQKTSPSLLQKVQDMDNDATVQVETPREVMSIEDEIIERSHPPMSPAESTIRPLDTHSASTPLPGEDDCIYLEEIPISAMPEFNGYCAYTLFHDEVSLPGLHSSGFIKYKGKYYSFCSKQAALDFRNMPEKYINGVIELVSKSPELIYFLNIEDHLATSTKQLAPMSSPNMDPVITSEMDCQTETHPIEKHIDYFYEFSEWKLRQRALKIVDLKNKQTHSTQTNASHFRRENESQVYLPKEKGTQTAKEKGTQPRKEVRYIKGLKGDPNTQNKQLTIITLTLDE